MWRENLEHSDDAKIGDNRRGHQRTNAQSATDFRIDARVVLHVVAGNELPAANAFAREPMLSVDLGTERRNRSTSRGAPYHVVFLFPTEGQRSAARSR